VVSFPVHHFDPAHGRVVPRVSVLAGGLSSEREISLASGTAVATALRELGEEVRELDPSEVQVSHCDWEPGEVALLALHGRGGEDGQIQLELETIGVAYTGCGVAASRRAFRKSRAKACFEMAGVPTPEAMILERGSDPVLPIGLFDRCGSAVVVKPDAQGSSLGVRLVRTPSDYSEALELAFSLGSRVLVERAVLGPEWTVGWLDDQPLPPTLIETPRGLFDFEAKYEDTETGLTFPSPVPGSTAAQVIQVSRRACEAIGTRGLVRVDLRVDEAGNPWVLEVNTIPGLTAHSLVPRAAAEAGLELGQLARQMILSASNTLRGCHIRQDQMPGFLPRAVS